MSTVIKILKSINHLGNLMIMGSIKEVSPEDAKYLSERGYAEIIDDYDYYNDEDDDIVLIDDLDTDTDNKINLNFNNGDK